MKFAGGWKYRARAIVVAFLKPEASTAAAPLGQPGHGENQECTNNQTNASVPVFHRVAYIVCAHCIPRARYLVNVFPKLTFVALLCACAWLDAQTVNIVVKESGGIRRTTYPVNARVPFPKGALRDVGAVALKLQDIEVPAQYQAESKWADGSVQWLDVDFNASIGPGEAQRYQLEYGEGVKTKTEARGLAVTENADSIDVGRVRLAKATGLLLLSVKYRNEVIGKGANGFAVTDAAGKLHDLTTVEGLKVEVVKPGPLYVVVRYTGRIVIDSGYSAPFVITAEMPNSKAWVKFSATFEDPAKRLREISFHTPPALGPQPWVWDFGTDRWTYGQLRNATESVVLQQTVNATGADAWKISTGTPGQEQIYETGTAERFNAIRWAHIQDGKEVIAFAMDTGGDRAGEYRITLDGTGQTAFRFAAAKAGTSRHLTVYEHFVAPPVQIGAATSPAAILSPLSVVVEGRPSVPAKLK